jgi:phosphoribosylformylglycinamidine synthase PurS subunit
LSGILRAELRKITTTRLWWIMLICVLVLSGGYAVGVAVLQPETGAPFDDPGIVRSIYNAGNPVARVLALMLGIATMGLEYRHQTLAATYLATPRRNRVLLGKAASLLLFGLLYGVASVLAGVVVGCAFRAERRRLVLPRPWRHWRSLALGAASLALWTMIGMGIGILIKNLLVAMLVGISFAYLVEPILALVCYLRDLDTPPQPAADRRDQRDARHHVADPVRQRDTPFAWWQGALVLAAWCLLPPRSRCSRPSAATSPDPLPYRQPSKGSRRSHPPSQARAPARPIHAPRGIGRAAPPLVSGPVVPRLSGMARVVVDVMPKPEILDPQGKAVTGALNRLGFTGVSVRQGKRFELELDGELTDERMTQVRHAAETLLANTVIETFAVKVETEAETVVAATPVAETTQPAGPAEPESVSR